MCSFKGDIILKIILKGKIVMSLFDDVVVNAKSAANVVSKKAGELYDISKLKLSAANLRGELNREYRAFGEAVYNNIPEAELQENKNRIKELKESLKDVTELLNSAKNQSTCPECGASVIKGAQFCHSCGATLNTGVSFCKKCGAELFDESKFCINCGAPVEDEGTEKSAE